MKASDSNGVVLHRASTKDMVGDAAAKAATKIGRIIANEGLVWDDGGVLVIRLNKRIGMRVFGGVAFHGSLGRRDVGRGFEKMVRGAMVRRELAEHITHTLFILLERGPALDGKGSEFAKRCHLAVLSSHSCEVKHRGGYSDVARK
jgi:hypothetical protein